MQIMLEHSSDLVDYEAPHRIELNRQHTHTHSFAISPPIRLVFEMKLRIHTQTDTHTHRTALQHDCIYTTQIPVPCHGMTMIIPREINM